MGKTRFQVGDRVRTGGGEGTIQGVEERADGSTYLIAYDHADGITIPLPASIVDAQAEARERQAQAQARLELAEGHLEAATTGLGGTAKSERVGATLGGLVVLGVIIFALSRCGGEKPPQLEAVGASKALEVTSASPDAQAATVGVRGDPSAPDHLDADRLTTYAVVLGRASGCGINVTAQGNRVGAWLNRVTQPGPERDSMNVIFMSGIIEHRDAQMGGRSPDTCDQVRQSFARFEWP